MSGPLPPPPPYPGFSPGHSSPLAQPPGLGMMSHPLHRPHHPVLDPEEKERVRFQVELEFVQCLANPNYLHFLAQRGYFKDGRFINYLRYLQYWKETPYLKFIKYPLCLHYLELLQHESFRKEIVNGQSVKFLDDQTILQWQHYTRRRVKLIESAQQQHLQSKQQGNENMTSATSTSTQSETTAASASTPITTTT